MRGLKTFSVADKTFKSGGRYVVRQTVVGNEGIRDAAQSGK